MSKMSSADQCEIAIALHCARQSPVNHIVQQMLANSEREQIIRSIRTSQALSGVTVSEDEARAALEQAERMPSARVGK